MVRGGRVGGISIISGVWVVRAVSPPTCAQGGSVGALDTPKLCPVVLKPARAGSERPRREVRERKRTCEMEAVQVRNTNKIRSRGEK